MDIARRIARAKGLTPVEQQMAQTVLAMGDRLQEVSIKEFARAASVSVASVHRFCKKIGLEGFKELKVEVARTVAARGRTGADVDINFPFGPGERPSRIAGQMRSLYASTIDGTCEALSVEELERAADLVGSARRCGIYAHSHNLHPAQMFCDRMLSIGREAFCHDTMERQYRSALEATEKDVAVVVSYSGIGPDVATRLSILAQRHVPTVFVGTPAARRVHPGLAAYLLVADQESVRDRITQFASHIAVQFVLDALFSCMFADSYDASTAFLKASLPYMSLLGRNPS